ncbi:MAG: four helix bundle protein [Bacteroidales bacterium]|nr:four helix bundle protein [Bacteroidales bacterium]
MKSLEVWQSAQKLCKDVRDLTIKEPFSKDYRLKENQIRSSSGSVMDNIAEGFREMAEKNLFNTFSISKGSCGETRSQSYRAFDYTYISAEELDYMIKNTESIGKRIGAFMNYLKRSEFKGNKFK